MQTEIRSEREMRAISFRPKQWLMQEIKDHMIKVGIDTKTEGLHSYIESLKNEISILKADVKTLKLYQGITQPETQKGKTKCLIFPFLFFPYQI